MCLIKDFALENVLSYNAYVQDVLVYNAHILSVVYVLYAVVNLVVLLDILYILSDDLFTFHLYRMF